MSGRRNFVAGAVAASVVPLATTASADAALLPLPTQHVAAQVAFNTRTCPDGSPEDDAFWNAYRRTIDTCLNTPATTLEGLIAKARMAQHELRTQRLDGYISPPSDVPEELARNIVADLLRLAGRR